MRSVFAGAIFGVVVLLPAPGWPAAPSSAATAAGSLTYGGRSVKLTHVACASTSWPLLRLVFTTTDLPREVLANETAKHDFLAAKNAPRIDIVAKFRDAEAPLYLMAGLTDPASRVNPGIEAIVEEPPTFTFHEKVVDDTRVAGRVATSGPAKTSANEIPYSFDVTFDVPRKACE